MPLMCWPNGSTTRPNISSPFGPRNVNQPGASSNHLGADFTGFSTVCAVADGEVIHVGWRSLWSGGGYMVWVQHDGFVSRSLHLAEGSARVSVGQKVARGDALATMGNTAKPYPVGKHLHSEIVLNGRQVDPVAFISARLGHGATASATGSKPVEVPTIPEEEDDMLALRITDYDGNKHLCTLGLGVFRHLIEGDNPERVKNIVRADDQWTDIGLNELPIYLKTYGCRGGIWRNEGGGFQVLDSESGNVMAGGMWSAAISR